ncbi:MAG: CPBP family intramembrane metalloprotease [Candidatus Heimdallarchaeota archaeon]|nr:MAG: CPBP family intramembrane metalloprotease [Candidatus Heimdallarchaeota archaeon]
MINENKSHIRKTVSIHQHSFRFLIALHLLPGVLLFMGMILFSQPVVVNFFGIDPKLGPVFGYLAASTLLLVEVLWLVREKRKSESSELQKKIIEYTEGSPMWQYFVAIPILVAFTLIMYLVIAPLVQPFIIDTFFSWYPQEYNFQAIIHDPSVLSNFKTYAGAQLLAIVNFILPATTLTIVEEFYFRGYLLPRMEEHVKGYAPLLNVILFSVYHFFSPWENLIRILALLPVVYLVWYKRDIRYLLITHLLANAVGGIYVLFMAF